MKDLIKRINELAKIAKERQLTKEEVEERERLRSKYIKAYREGMKNTLLNIKVVDEHGNDVTPTKLKEEREKNKGGEESVK